MVESITEMPDGTLGFRASDNLTSEDFTGVLLPPIREVVNSGGGIRLLFVATVDMGHFEPVALWQNLKADIDPGMRDSSAWKRVAIATDLGWLQRTTSTFGWMAPGEIQLFAGNQTSEAKAWLIA